MAGMVFVFVREDASEAETLAEAFDDAGFQITGNASDPDALTVIVWSRHAVRSSAFRRAAECALRSSRAVVASLSAAPAGADLNGAPIIDLSNWDGEQGGALDPLFEAADAIDRPALSNVIELPFRPAYEDAEFVELTPGMDSDERARRARQSWEAPIPTGMLRPVYEPPAKHEPKLGAAQPRRDFRRLAPRRARAPAVLALAACLLAGGGVLAANFAAAPRSPVMQTPPALESSPISLTSASAAAVGLEDVAAIEAPAQAGRAGIEPGSAPRRAGSAPRRAAYQAPPMIPDDIVAELQRPEGPRG